MSYFGQISVEGKKHPPKGLNKEATPKSPPNTPPPPRPSPPPHPPSLSPGEAPPPPSTLSLSSHHPYDFLSSPRRGDAGKGEPPGEPIIYGSVGTSPSQPEGSRSAAMKAGRLHREYSYSLWSEAMASRYAGKAGRQPVPRSLALLTRLLVQPRLRLGSGSPLPGSAR